MSHVNNAFITVISSHGPWKNYLNTPHPAPRTVASSFNCLNDARKSYDKYMCGKYLHVYCELART